MNFDDSEVIDKIHLNYRLIYLKDTALATGLDEGNTQVISNLIINNNSDLIHSILLDQDSINKVFHQLEDSDMNVRKEAISFLSEIFSISKSLQMQGRINLLSSFKNIKEFNMSIFIRNCIKLKDDILNGEEKSQESIEEAEKLIVNCLDILQNYLQSFPINLTDLCCSSTNNDELRKLFESLTGFMISSDSQGMKLQIHELLKFLLENDNSIGTAFYESSFPAFSKYLSEEMKENDRDHNDLVDLTKSLIVDLINKSIVEDNYNTKGFIDKHDILVKISGMVKFNSKIQNMTILKFYKCLIASNFKPYITEIIKLNLCYVIAEVYEKIENKKNMVASIALDLFNTIEKKEHYDLAKHLCDKYEIVHPFLKNAAEKYKEKVGFYYNSNFYQSSEMKKTEDNIFNGYEDSVADEKANQDAYENHIGFGDDEEIKEENYKKFSFLAQNTPIEPEVEEFLIKPRITPNNPPKIVIDSSSFSNIKPAEKTSQEEKGNEKTKSVIGTLNILKEASKYVFIDENYVHKPIEFIEAQDILGNENKNQGNKEEKVDEIPPTEEDKGKKEVKTEKEETQIPVVEVENTQKDEKPAIEKPSKNSEDDSNKTEIHAGKNSYLNTYSGDKRAREEQSLSINNKRVKTDEEEEIIKNKIVEQKNAEV